MKRKKSSQALLAFSVCLVLLSCKKKQAIEEDHVMLWLTYQEADAVGLVAVDSSPLEENLDVLQKSNPTAYAQIMQYYIQGYELSGKTQDELNRKAQDGRLGLIFTRTPTQLLLADIPVQHDANQSVLWANFTQVQEINKLLRIQASGVMQEEAYWQLVKARVPGIYAHRETLMAEGFGYLEEMINEMDYTTKTGRMGYIYVSLNRPADANKGEEEIPDACANANIPARTTHRRRGIEI